MSDTARTAGERWTVADAVNWVAFRVEPKDAPETVICRSGPFRSINLMNALAARASGNPRSWPGPSWRASDNAVYFDGTPARLYHYRARVKSWMRDTGLTASSLLAMAEIALKDYKDARRRQDDQQAQLAMGLKQINKAVSEARLIAWGRPAKGYGAESVEPRVAIPSNYVDEVRNIDPWERLRVTNLGLDYGWFHDKGPWFCEITFAEADVKCCFPLLTTREAGISLASPDIPTLLIPGSSDSKLLAMTTEATEGRRLSVKAEYTVEALRAWFLLRVRSWPSDKPPPTAKVDLEAANDYFHATVRRDEFRQIRNDKVPENWRKPGPRGKRP